jgi:SPP1 gp7 family putative phage head morphogenesis protein
VPRHVKPPTDEFQALLERNSITLRRAMDGLVIAKLSGTTKQRQQARQEAGDVLVQTAALADMLGRRRLLLELDARVGASGVSRAREEDLGGLRAFRSSRPISYAVNRDPGIGRPGDVFVDLPASVAAEVANAYGGTIRQLGIARKIVGGRKGLLGSPAAIRQIAGFAKEDFDGAPEEEGGLSVPKATQTRVRKWATQVIQDLARGFSVRAFSLNEQTPIVPVPFEEAITDLLERDPRLAVGWLEVQRVYTRERGFSLARSLDETITDRIQIIIAQAIREGQSPTRTQEGILEAAQGNALPFTRGYVETVYRTNANTAYNAGRMRQARDPAVRAVTPGFRYDAVGDADTRKNHRAMDGVVAAQDDPIWSTCSPPLGYNCRCVLALATRSELRREGVIRDGRTFQVSKPPDAGPDEGFAKVGRTDQQVYPAGPPL